MRCYNLYMNEILNEAPFAAKVKYLRAKLMLAQEALAKELGVSFAHGEQMGKSMQNAAVFVKRKILRFLRENGNNIFG